MPKWSFVRETEQFKGDTLYFIQQGNDGPIKIGRGESARNRLNRLQTGNPEVLRLLGELPNEGYSEAFWHYLFETCRMRGEWFEPRADLRRAIHAALAGKHWARHAYWAGMPQPDELSVALDDAHEIYQDLVFGGMRESAAAQEAIALAVAEFV